MPRTRVRGIAASGPVSAPGSRSLMMSRLSTSAEATTAPDPSRAVSLLASTALPDGRELVFSLIADQVPDAGTNAAKKALDAIAGRLAACGCR